MSAGAGDGGTPITSTATPPGPSTAPPSFPAVPPKQRLYAWQGEALDEWRRADRRGIVEAVTGTGKTRIGVIAIEDALARGGRAVVLVPTKELQEQWYLHLRSALEPKVRLGRLGDGHRDGLESHRVVVAIAASARRQPMLVPPASLLVADECHRYAAATSQLALDARFTQRLGLTATLERSDRLEHLLISYFGPVCFRIGYARALADSVVAPFSVALLGIAMSGEESIAYRRATRRLSDLFMILRHQFGFPTRPFFRFMRELKEAASSEWSPARQPAMQFLSAVYERKRILAMSRSKAQAVRLLVPAMRVANRTLVFTESVLMADSMARRLRRDGLRVRPLHSGLSGADRHNVFEQFRTGQLDVLVAPRVLDEGVNVPEADLAVIVSASQTRRQMIQRMGRILRRKADGRIARFAIMYLEDTTEDPKLGAHESFLSEIISVADDYEVFSVPTLLEALVFLSTTEPLTPSMPQRLIGDAPRHIRSDWRDDEFCDAADVLALSTSAGHQT